MAHVALKGFLQGTWGKAAPAFGFLVQQRPKTWEFPKIRGPKHDPKQRGSYLAKRTPTKKNSNLQKQKYSSQCGSALSLPYVNPPSPIKGALKPV